MVQKYLIAFFVFVILIFFVDIFVKEFDRRWNTCQKTHGCDDKMRISTTWFKTNGAPETVTQKTMVKKNILIFI